MHNTTTYCKLQHAVKHGTGRLSDQCDFLVLLSPEKRVLCLEWGIKELEDR